MRVRRARRAPTNILYTRVGDAFVYVHRTDASVAASFFSLRNFHIYLYFFFSIALLLYINTIFVFIKKGLAT